jgi:hypothetical protein
MKAVMYLGDDGGDTNAFRKPDVCAQEETAILSVGMLYVDSPARLIKSAGVIVDGLA